MAETLKQNAEGLLEGSLELYGQLISGTFTPGQSPHGECKIHMANSGTVATVLFDSGQLVRKVRVEQVDGTLIEFADGNEQAGYTGRKQTLEYTYEGQLDPQGRMHGHGIIRYAFGLTRAGTFKQNKPVGHITTEYVPAQYTTEDFDQSPPALVSIEGRGSVLKKLDGKFFGQIWLDGGRTRFKGQLDEQGLPHGPGVEEKAGYKRQGSWEHGRFVKQEAVEAAIDHLQEGYADVEIALPKLPEGLEERVVNGCRIKGRWITGQLHGLALIEQSGGTKSLVQFDYGVVRRRFMYQTPTAKWEFQDGDERRGYFGQYHSNAEDYTYVGKMNAEGMQHGRGRRMYTNGNVVEAEFANGQIHGRVFKSNIQNDYWVSVYDQGAKVKDVQVKVGDKYWFFESGDAQSGYKGELIVAFKYSYVGQFKPDGTQHGAGVRKSVDGEAIEGQFCDGFAHGKVKHTYENGSVAEETFDMGQLLQ